MHMKSIESYHKIIYQLFTNKNFRIFFILHVSIENDDFPRITWKSVLFTLFFLFKWVLSKTIYPFNFNHCLSFLSIIFILSLFSCWNYFFHKHVHTHKNWFFWDVQVHITRHLLWKNTKKLAYFYLQFNKYHARYAQFIVLKTIQITHERSVELLVFVPYF